MTTDPELIRALEDLRQLSYQIEMAITLIESGKAMYVTELNSLKSGEIQLGDFVVRRRFPKPVAE